MQTLFSPDSKFMRGMSRFADLVILNVLFLLTSLPIFTIGAAYTALYTVCFRFGTDRDAGIFRSYFRAFRDNFKQSTLLWLFFLLFGIVLCVNIFLFYSLSGAMHYLFVVFVILLIVVALMAAYAFPLLSQFDNDNKSTLKNALILSVGYLPRSIVIVVIHVFPAAVLLMNFYVFLQSGFLWVFLYFSAAVYISTFLLKKIFAPYMLQEESEEDAK